MNKHDLIYLFWESNYFLGRNRQINVTVESPLIFIMGIAANKWIHGNINDH